MMKIKFLLAAVLIFLSGTAHAISVPFAWDSTSMSATGAFALSSFTSTSGSTNPLGNGDSQGGLNFGKVTLIGGGVGTLNIGVNFSSPELSVQNVSGPYDVWSALIFSGGHWTGGTTDFAYSYMGNNGTARLTLNPISIDKQLGATFKFLGSITNMGSQVAALPEPGTLLLLTFGLAAVAWVKRRKLV